MSFVKLLFIDNTPNSSYKDKNIICVKADKVDTKLVVDTFTLNIK